MYTVQKKVIDFLVSHLELGEGTTNQRIRRVEEGDAGEYDCEVYTL
jgi:hypothetical protein